MESKTISIDEAYLTVKNEIFKDLETVYESCLDAVTLAIPNSDNPFVLHGNIKIQNGIFKDIILPIVITLSSDYPSNLPIIRTSPGCKFGSQFNSQIIESQFGNILPIEQIMAMRLDIMTNNLMKDCRKINKKSRWKPVHRIPSFINQLILFFSINEFNQNSEIDIEYFRKEHEYYT